MTVKILFNIYGNKIWKIPVPQDIYAEINIVHELKIIMH